MFFAVTLNGEIYAGGFETIEDADCWMVDNMDGSEGKLDTVEYTPED